VLQSQTINQQVEMVEKEVKYWPTPEASQGGRQGGSFSQNSWKKEDGTPKQPSLAQATIMDQQVTQWRTPSVAEEKNQAHSQQIYLQNQVGATSKKWATPHANCSTGVGQSPNKDGAQNLQTQSNGKLNPRWVCVLMNLPALWVKP